MDRLKKPGTIGKCDENIQYRLILSQKRVWGLFRCYGCRAQTIDDVFVLPDPFSNPSSTHALIKLFKSGAMCFEKAHKMHECRSSLRTRRKNLRRHGILICKGVQRSGQAIWQATLKFTAARDSCINQWYNRFAQNQRNKRSHNERSN